MNLTARRETYCRQAAHKLITSLHSKRYRPSGMLIHKQNSYATGSKRGAGQQSLKNSIITIGTQNRLP
jgi:hypothetical protein